MTMTVFVGLNRFYYVYYALFWKKLVKKQRFQFDTVGNDRLPFLYPIQRVKWFAENYDINGLVKLKETFSETVKITVIK